MLTNTQGKVVYASPRALSGEMSITNADHLFSCAQPSLGLSFPPFIASYGRDPSLCFPCAICCPMVLLAALWPALSPLICFRTSWLQPSLWAQAPWPPCGTKSWALSRSTRAGVSGLMPSRHPCCKSILNTMPLLAFIGTRGQILAIKRDSRFIASSANGLCIFLLASMKRPCSSNGGRTSIHWVYCG